MIHSRKRVSYFIPPPATPVPRLRLPQHPTTHLGRSAPLLIRADESAEELGDAQFDIHDGVRHPRHRLGVASLALDTCTVLEGRQAPEGILYSGGRDGLLMSWDLGLPMKKKAIVNGQATFVRGRWEVITGWADEPEDEDTDGHERTTSDGDVIGDVPLSAAIRRRHMLKELNVVPYERQWETDLAWFKPGTPSSFRQCAQVHGDWVNDLILCNLNQTVVSASSDGTVQAWNPHTLPSSEPTVIGLHGDYVRCIAYSREQRWIASGSFDRSIKLWDLNGSSKTEPLANLVLPDSTASKSSIYALATDQFGHTIASGSPERVIRLWDPRTGKRTGKLVGHTDNIRAILISDDSRYLLTGSADASIKLWSLASQRCLHTFTHHADSVWALHSAHPSLEVFYSGDKSGFVCKVDVEGCADMSQGECILLCNESGETPSAGINKIVSMDDNLLWTASGVSSINRWHVPQRRSARATASLYAHHEDKEATSADSSPFLNHLLTASPTRFSHAHNGSLEFPSSQPGTRPSTAPAASEPTPQPVHQSVSFDTTNDHEQDTTRFGIPYDNLIRLTSPNDPFPYHLGRGGVSVVRGGRYADADVATLYSAASFLSIPRTLSHIKVTPHHHSPQPQPPGPFPLPHNLHPQHQQHHARHQSPPRSSRIPHHHPSHPSLTQPRSQTSSPTPPDLETQPHPRPRSHSLHPTPHPHSRPNSPSQRFNANTHSHSLPTQFITSPSSPPLSLPSPPPSLVPPPPALPSQPTIHLSPHPLSSRCNYDLRELASDATPFSRSPDYVIAGDTGIVRVLPLNDRIHVLTVDTVGEVAVWNIARGACLGRYKEADVAAAVSMAGRSAACDGAAGAVGGSGSGGGGSLPSAVGTTGESGPREALEAVREKIEGQAIIPKWASVEARGGVLVVHLNERCFEVEMYADEIGYANEKGFTEESKVNLGKWALRNLFIGFIREQQRIRKEAQSAQATSSPTDSASSGTHDGTLHSRANMKTSPTWSPHSRRKSNSPEIHRRHPKPLLTHPTFSSNVVTWAPDMILALPPNTTFPVETRAVPLSAPLIPIRSESNTPNWLPTPIRPRVRAETMNSSTVNGRTLPSATRLSTEVPTTISAGDYFASLTRRPKTAGRVASGTNTTIVNGDGSQTPTPSDEVSKWSSTRANPDHRPLPEPPLSTPKANQTPFGVSRPVTPTTKFIGRLKSFSKLKRPQTSAAETTTMTSVVRVGGGRSGAFVTTTTKPTTTSTTTKPPTTTSSLVLPTSTTNETRRKSFDPVYKDSERNMVQQVFSGSISPPSSSEAPNVALPSQTVIVISEEASPNHLAVYRGTVGTTSYDLRSLEECMPLWLAAYLLQNKMPTAPPVSKVSFVLLPWVSKDPDMEILPELLNTAQSKLTASRYLRVRKLVIHVQEKLDKINASRTNSPQASPTSAVFDDKQDSMNKHKSRAEDTYEILCNDVLLPLDMTLAAVRQYVWKSSAELKMHYRLKLGKRKHQ
ncbi:hypothetical protein APHAL10511_000406 [Amanita phalloides]|nr:hypothetical protein APHAL10511_000406 [Amanita phalloides]